MFFHFSWKHCHISADQTTHFQRTPKRSSQKANDSRTESIRFLHRDESFSTAFYLVYDSKIDVSEQRREIIVQVVLFRSDNGKLYTNN